MTGDDQFDQVRLFPEIGQPTWVELIVATYSPPHVLLHRELADPAVYGDIRALALAHGIHPTAGHSAYRRLPGGGLQPLAWSAAIDTGLSLVVVPGNLPADGLTRVQTELVRLPDVLPTRMVWLP